MKNKNILNILLVMLILLFSMFLMMVGLISNYYALYILIIMCVLFLVLLFDTCYRYKSELRIISIKELIFDIKTGVLWNDFKKGIKL